ncbi:hypothetical protein EIP86_000368 [Pleurotus ostreatoroseus]|nr:hypothetical protein EIP86_000368 [Pleurotus ostreatoroseus]
MATAASASATAPPQSQAEALKALTFQRLHPKTYLERFLAERVRPDGREPDEGRDVSVNVGSISTADGSALVRIGQTTVVCGVKAEIAEPELDRPEEGFLGTYIAGIIILSLHSLESCTTVPNLDLPAICSPKFKPGPPSEEAQVLSDRLNEILVASRVLPTSSLCIARGKAVWVLYVDATCINYDGNVFDAALIAMVAALQNTRLPKATFDEDKGRTICTRKEMLPLQIDRLPLAISFGVFDATHILIDPTAFEEPLLDTNFTIVIDEKGDTISVMQLGLGIVGSQDVLTKCIASAKAHAAQLRGQIYNK